MAKRKEDQSTSGMLASVFYISFVVYVVIMMHQQGPVDYSIGSTACDQTQQTPIQTLRSTTSTDDYMVDEACRKLPSIRPGGSYFLDAKIGAGESAEGVLPAFKIGSYYPEKVKYHMATDKANFVLVREVLRRRQNRGLAIDFGANQGFYTYYFATLGLDVHSFEINEENFKALQHGAEFNPREVSDRVNLYPVGMGQTNARFGMEGSNYEGYLKEGKQGPILGATFDCFADHTKIDLANIAFVKLDVEGFEIAVLKGAQNSLFHPSRKHSIGGMIVEVGPDRWKRANVAFDEGVAAMEKLAGNFRKSYLLTRASGGYTKECPVSLGTDHLQDLSPKEVENNRMFRIQPDEWKGLLKAMQDGGKDCNFFYEN